MTKHSTIYPIKDQKIKNICQCFIRCYLNYGDIIYDEALNNSSNKRLETNQYIAVQAIAGSIRISSIVYVDWVLNYASDWYWQEKLVVETKFKISLILFWKLQGKKIVIVFRGVFRTQSNIYDGAFQQKQLTALSYLPSIMELLEL